MNQNHQRWDAEFGFPGNGGNERYLPPYIGNREINAGNVRMCIGETDGGFAFVTPEWVSDLIFVQANICKVTPEGTFASALPLLEHLARTGVNALWLTPFFENRGNANRTSHYGNHGPHTLAADCFRAQDDAGRAEELKTFVRWAHERNIYVFADVVTYGVLGTSPIYQAYCNREPFEGMDVSEWFTGQPLYSGYRFRWESPTLRQWFTDRMVDLITQYDLDGFRVDSEPSYLWYDSDGDGVPDRYADLFAEVRLRVAGYQKQPDGSYRYPSDATGRAITVFTEKNNLRTDGYDFEQYGVIHYGGESILKFQISNGTHHNWFQETDLASSVLEGRIADGRWFTESLHSPSDQVNCFRYYTYCISNHDYHSTAVNRRLWVAGYQALLAPFLPIWYCGEECGLISDENIWLNALNADPIRLLQAPENAAFYADVCRLVAIRRGYPDLFGCFADDIRNSNIASVSVSKGCLGYIRYSADRMALVLANPGQTDSVCQAEWSDACFPCQDGQLFSELLRGIDYHATRNPKGRLCMNGISIPAGGMAVLLASRNNDQ